MEWLIWIAQTDGGESAKGSSEMMQLLTSLAGASPIGVLMIIVIWLFLKHLNEQREQSEKRHDERHQHVISFTSAQTERMEEVVGQCKEVIKDNTLAMRENSAALGRVGK